MFKWACLILAAVLVAGFGWIVNDLRIAVKGNIHTIDKHLPAIMANTQKSSATLAVLSDDIKHLRDLAGVSEGPRDRSLVVYADRLLDQVESSGGQIGLQKKVFGSGLKDVLPAGEWVVGARKEALWLSFRAKTKGELLQRITQNKFGSPWHIQLADADPLPLADWLAKQDAETAAASAQQPETGDSNER